MSAPFFPMPWRPRVFATCRSPGCERKASAARGYCPTHYDRLRRELKRWKAMMAQRRAVASQDVAR